jgi:hypothetical protein
MTHIKSNMLSLAVTWQRIATTSSVSVLTSLPSGYHLTADPQLAAYFLWLTLTQSHSESQSYVTIDGLSASLSWCEAPSEAQDQIFVTVTRLWVCWCGTPSLTTGRVCCFQLLLVLACTFILVCDVSPAEPSIPVFYCLRFKTSQSAGPGPCVYPLGTGWPIYAPRQWVPFSLPINSSGGLFI